MKPPCPSADGSDPPPIDYNGGRIYTSSSKQAYRTIRTKGDFEHGCSHCEVFDQEEPHRVSMAFELKLGLPAAKKGRFLNPAETRLVRLAWPGVEFEMARITYRPKTTATPRPFLEGDSGRWRWSFVLDVEDRLFFLPPEDWVAGGERRLLRH